MKQIVCFGDSNTWGYCPQTKDRFERGLRWTGILQDKFEEQNIRIIEEGLCGRTTVHEDISRPNRKGINSIPDIMVSHGRIDQVILMLGTNDCKAVYHNSAKEIAKGAEHCVDELLRYVCPEQILLVSPIHLGEEVWKSEYDPEFDRRSVAVSKKLKVEYSKVAKAKKVSFLAASDFVKPSKEDQEHFDAAGHKRFAEIVYDKLADIESQRQRKSYPA